MPKKVERMKPPYIPLYVRDLLSSLWVDQMDDQQFGWYLRMLLRSWDYEVPCHIPNTPEMILLFAKAKQEDFDTKGWLVLGRFKVTEDGTHIYNVRLLSEYDSIIGKCKANAKAAKKRWGGTAEALRKESKRNADGMRTHTKRTADAMPPESKRNAIPEPEADTESKPVETKPSAKKTRGATSDPSAISRAAGETKHKRIEGMIQTAWEEQNPEGKCPWGKGDGQQLKLMLEKTGSWTDHQYAQCLIHMYASEGFARSNLPVHFLPKLPSYYSGPKDRFGNTINQGNGNGNSKAQRIQDDSLNAIQTAISRINGRAAGNPEGRVSKPERDSGDGGVVLDGVLSNPPRSRATTAGSGD